MTTTPFVPPTRGDGPLRFSPEIPNTPGPVRDDPVELVHRSRALRARAQVRAQPQLADHVPLGAAGERRRPRRLGGPWRDHRHHPQEGRLPRRLPQRVPAPRRPHRARLRRVRPALQVPLARLGLRLRRPGRRRAGPRGLRPGHPQGPQGAPGRARRVGRLGVGSARRPRRRPVAAGLARRRHPQGPRRLPHGGHVPQGEADLVRRRQLEGRRRRVQRVLPRAGAAPHPAAGRQGRPRDAHLRVRPPLDDGRPAQGRAAQAAGEPRPPVGGDLPLHDLPDERVQQQPRAPAAVPVGAGRAQQDAVRDLGTLVQDRRSRLHRAHAAALGPPEDRRGRGRVDLGGRGCGIAVVVLQGELLQRPGVQDPVLPQPGQPHHRGGCRA